MPRNTYVAIAPDGSRHTRKTGRTYSHAVLNEGKEGWKAVGFCGRPDLAEKKKGEHPGSVVVECSVLGDAKADKPKAKPTEKTEASTGKPERTPKTKDRKPKRTIGRLVEELLMDETLNYKTIVDRVMAEFPDAKTTPRSVASVAAVMRRNGVRVLRRKGA